MRLNASPADMEPSTKSMKKPFICPREADMMLSNRYCSVASLAQLGTISPCTELVIYNANSRTAPLPYSSLPM